MTVPLPPGPKMLVGAERTDEFKLVTEMTYNRTVCQRHVLFRSLPALSLQTFLATDFHKVLPAHKLLIHDCEYKCK